ncbi:MAG: arginine--tRNA ligase [Bacteroidales bacterium]|jgi:arginyl-tRNA synthetase|nr:arginine--tRNA ligase [Bacteroidales bacterium]MDD2569874.1 arginine--tRNA ligase [Bacteroidales bacterium]MDD3384691.1 arginine--tRNA ligase [Bacteroidales bacterium]MDD3812189.1 arginine--tRNA ligase [Bacteroidales bacterium]MDD3870906.1 arginine--tRNA ligase [Bacteroidales bacterium]
MDRIETRIAKIAALALADLYQAEVMSNDIQVQPTRKDQQGDFTLVVFPYTRFSRRKPEETASQIGDYLKTHLEEIERFEVIKGFLNLFMSDHFWLHFFKQIVSNPTFGQVTPTSNSPRVLVEFSSPNTNKPLHLGHIRNNLLGNSVSRIISAAGSQVTMVNLVNDRGIHICKSMIAWLKWGDGITPEQSGKKGDKLVGDFYVMFDQAYKKEIAQLMASGMTEEAAKAQAPILLEAQDLLRRWEKDDPEVLQIWEMMNQWVYQGFDETYRQLGISFDRTYYESQTYKLGRNLVLKGLEQGILYQKEDGSIWADLTDDGLDHKLLLRADGTSVYMTQDLGTAHQRFEEYGFNRHIYVVGNEQDYHFKVLSLILGRLGFDWSDRLYHLSYGMVELPQGRMKSREGTVIDADDLISEMIKGAEQVSGELGKLEGFPDEEKQQVYDRIALGALKYYILKVDPQKTMLFNPEESIDFNGNTGPFLQYTYVRIRSVERKAAEMGITRAEGWKDDFVLDDREKVMLKRIYQFPGILAEAANTLSPALIANYCFDLVKEFNHFYQQCPISKEENAQRRNFRLDLSGFIAGHLQESLKLLGMEMPNRM